MAIAQGGERRGVRSGDGCAVGEPVAPGERGGVRRYALDLAARFEEHDLLTSASAISFQVLTAIVPFLCFAFALLGFVHLGDVWHDDVAPHIRHDLSPAAFQMVDQTVKSLLSDRKVFWMTAGLVLTIWQISGAVRASMGALNRIYRCDHDRAWGRRMLVSTGLAVVVGVLLLAALAVATLGTLLYGGVGQPLGALLFVVRWTIVAWLALVAVGVLLHFGPGIARPARWVTVGTGLVIVAWVLMSVGFGAYLRYVADYASVFGNLATVVVLMAYLYLSALVFLGGAQLDALLRKRIEGA